MIDSLCIFLCLSSWLIFTFYYLKKKQYHSIGYKPFLIIFIGDGFFCSPPHDMV
ncbi:uncharacterized protein BX663DRAFT_500807 [Cokeromyces recurvatus]|uniref:uncharacterized protein n=1 Tax=Cokeromyces recurvatus TaxID=90255 RepID=UPI002220CCF3|nr:uncharacterized protein BX663DRAFT_500807 [Cokeromyces recurvatus]KAI7905758.1 hypothetical protein BX663DRAFT_500807 [Cokeromyces recurvatus]